MKTFIKWAFVGSFLALLAILARCMRRAYLQLPSVPRQDDEWNGL